MPRQKCKRWKYFPICWGLFAYVYCLFHIQTIRIYHEYGIEKSIPRINHWHHEACRGMTISDPEGRIFLSHPHAINGFLFLLTTKYLICIGKIWKRLPENPENVEMRHGDIILTLQLERAVHGAPSQITTLKFWTPQHPAVPPWGMTLATEWKFCSICFLSFICENTHKVLHKNLWKWHVNDIWLFDLAPRSPVWP